MRWALSTDPGVMRLCDLLSLDEFAVIGRLHRLWSWADQHTTDGKLSGVSSVTLDRYMLTANFSAALCAVGWAVDEPDGFRLLKFEVHNGNSAKKRALQSKRVKRFRNADALPEKRREEKRLSPNGDNNSGGDSSGPIDGDPWGKPARVPVGEIRDEAERRRTAANVNPHLAESSGLLREFGFNVSNAAKYGASLNATPERVRWLCSEAKRLAELGKITEPVGFVIAGIRSAKDPDPGPEILTPEAQLDAVLARRSA